MCSKIFVVGGRVLPKERISVGDSTVNYDTNFAVRFPKKVRRLVLVGARIDIAAAESQLSRFVAGYDSAASARFRTSVSSSAETGRAPGAHVRAPHLPSRPPTPRRQHKHNLVLAIPGALGGGANAGITALQAMSDRAAAAAAT